MYKIFVDEQLFFSPELGAEYALLSASLSSSLGKVDTLTLSIPSTHPKYALPQMMLSEIVVFRGTECVFVGRPISIERDFYNTKTVYCESVAGYLNDVIVHGDAAAPSDGIVYKEEYESDTLYVSAFMYGVLTTVNDIREAGYLPTDKYYRFNTGNIGLPSTASGLEGFEVGVAKSAMEYLQELPRLLNVGGGYAFRYSGLDYLLISGGTPTYWTLPDSVSVKRRDVYIDWLSFDSVDTPAQTIEFGVNLVDMTEKIEMGDVYTAVHPVSKRFLFDPDAPGGIAPDDSCMVTLYNNSDSSQINEGYGDYVPDKSKIYQYGYRTLNKQFDKELYTTRDLLNYYLDNDTTTPGNFAFKRTLSVTAVDRVFIEANATPIHAGNYARILSPPHDLDETLLCTDITLDLLNPIASNYAFGAVKTTMTAQSASELSWTKRKLDRLG